VSLEPLLGGINLEPFSPLAKKRTCNCDRKKNNYTADNPYCKWPHGKDFLDWVIVGCESGPQRRTMDQGWALDLIEQCRQAKLPVFMKQMEVGGKVTGDIERFPNVLQIREFPGEGR